MRIGYPCLNRTLACRNNHSFKLAGYTDTRLCETVAANLACLADILRFNGERGMFYFRITSDLVPFASHPVCTFPWAVHFAAELARLGRYIRAHGLRIAMHPDQFVLLNALDERIVESSVRELEYHARLLDLMELDTTARIQIHVGGLYGDRASALQRFVREYERLPEAVRRRLVIENDDRLFALADCMGLHFQTGVPVLFDVFHHRLLNHGEPLAEAVALAATTWQETDGPLLVDYSTQEPGARRGKHAVSLDETDFRAFLASAPSGIDFDIMLEIGDKEQSAARALAILSRR